MKLLCFFISVPLGNSNVSVLCEALARELIKDGHHVIFLPWGVNNIQGGNENEFIVKQWPSKRPIHFRDAIFLAKLIRQYRPDCMIGHFGSVNLMMMVGWLMGTPVRIAYYHTLHEQIRLDSKLSSWKLRILDLRKTLVYKMCSFIIPVSQNAAKDVQEFHQVSEKSIKVFLNTVKDPGLGAFSKNNNELVCVGRLDPCKGQDVLIRSISILKNDFPLLKIKFLGGGGLKTELQKLAQEIGVEDQCVFVGPVAHEEIFKQMGSAKIVIVPSRSEAFGYVCIEALAVGTPVIASAVGGIVEIIRDGVDGYLVPPDNADLLADRIKTLLEDESLYLKMCADSRQHFLDKFEHSKVISEQAGWFEEISIKK